MPVRILIVDDEPKYLWALRVNLLARDFEVLTSGDGREAIELAAREEPDLILLDIRMPGLDGYEVCQRIRDFSTVPIIMLTAVADTVDKVKGLDAGADDYLTKPFSVEELLARVRAVLRRTELMGWQERSPFFEMGDLRLELAGQRVHVRGQEISLTPTEYHLLTVLIENMGRILTPQHLLETVWGAAHNRDSSLLRQAIHRLRQKIEPDPATPRYIHTRHGIGYVFAPPD